MSLDELVSMADLLDFHLTPSKPRSWRVRALREARIRASSSIFGRP